MKTRKVIVEILSFVLMMNWFYEGIYKVAHWSEFIGYMEFAPLLKPVGHVLAFVIPIGELALALMLFFPRQRMKALYVNIVVLIIFVVWVMSVHFYTHRLFWPYQAFWKNTYWLQKVSISLGLCWISFMSIMLSNSTFQKEIKSLSMLAKGQDSGSVSVEKAERGC